MFSRVLLQFWFTFRGNRMYFEWRASESHLRSIEPLEPCRMPLLHAPTLPAPCNHCKTFQKADSASFSALHTRFRLSALRNGNIKKNKSQACKPRQDYSEPPRTYLCNSAPIEHGKVMKSQEKPTYPTHYEHRLTFCQKKKVDRRLTPFVKAKAPWMKLHRFSVHLFGLDAVIDLRCWQGIPWFQHASATDNPGIATAGCYDVLWCSMMFYDVLWCSMMFYDVLWCSMMFYDVLWCSMMFYDVLWCSMMFYDVLWCSMMFYDVLWCSMMFYDVLWCSMMFYDVLWCSMMFYDVLWCSMMFYDSVTASE